MCVCLSFQLQSNQHLHRSICRLCLLRSQREVDKHTHAARCRLRVKCKACGAPMDKISNKISHFAAHVMACGGENIYACSSCNYQTTTKADYKSHIKSCSIRDRMCVKCNKAFNSTLELKAHLLAIHPAIKCTICSAKFMTHNELKKHLVHEHSSMDM